MATVDGFKTDSQNDLVGGLIITLLADGVPAQARAYQEIALIGKVPAGNTTWRIATNDAKTVNTALAEGDQADYTSFTTSGVNITASVYPVRSLVSLELQQDAIGIDVIQKALREHMDVILNAADANVFANISSATNTTDHTGASLDKTKINAALLAFKKQAGRDQGEIVFVGSYRQIHEIVTAFANDGSTVMGVPGVASDPLMKNPGVIGARMVAGLPCYEANVPASGGSDVSGAFLMRGKSLAIGFWGDKPMDARLDPPAGRVGTEALSWSRYGTGLIKQANVREVISLA